MLHGTGLRFYRNSSAEDSGILDGIIDNDGLITYYRRQLEDIVKEYYSNLLMRDQDPSSEDIRMGEGGDNSCTFSKEDVIRAMKMTNFNKGLGTDDSMAQS